MKELKIFNLCRAYTLPSAIHIQINWIQEYSMVNWIRRKRKDIKSQDITVAQSFFILSRLPQLLTGLHFTVTASVAASVAVPPARVHLTSKGSTDCAPKAGLLWELMVEGWRCPYCLDGSDLHTIQMLTKVRSPHPWIDLWGAVHSQTVHGWPICPSRC